jgi:uncharacterized protein (DUF1697 family)
MSQFIAFLRGLNVGGHVVKMDRLRGLFEELRFSDVETFIASGNVIFQTATRDVIALEKRIEAHLKRALGYEVATCIRTPPELAQIAAEDPFAKTLRGGTKVAIYVVFLREKPSSAVREKILSFQTKLDEIVLREREFYWLCRGQTTESKVFGPGFLKAIGMPMTTRNITTVRKLAALYATATA